MVEGRMNPFDEWGAHYALGLGIRERLEGLVGRNIAEADIARALHDEVTAGRLWSVANSINTPTANLWSVGGPVPNPYAEQMVFNSHFRYQFRLHDQLGHQLDRRELDDIRRSAPGHRLVYGQSAEWVIYDTESNRSLVEVSRFPDLRDGESQKPHQVSGALIALLPHPTTIGKWHLITAGLSAPGSAMAPCVVLNPDREKVHGLENVPALKHSPCGYVVVLRFDFRRTWPNTPELLFGQPPQWNHLERAEVVGYQVL